MHGVLHQVAKPRAIVVDLFKCLIHVEFVEQRLYRYVEESGVEAMRSLWSLDSFQKLVSSVRRQVTRDARQHPEWNVAPIATGDRDTIIRSLNATLKWYMNRGYEPYSHFDLKRAIYSHGYRTLKLRTVVYSDAVRCLRSWRQQGISLTVYSTQDALFQRQLLSHTTAGDLTPLFHHILDPASLDQKEEGMSATTVANIASKIAVPASDLVYLASTPAAVEAARQATATAFLVVSHPVIQFEGLDPRKVQAVDRIRIFDDLRWLPSGSKSSDSESTGSSARDDKSSQATVAASSAAATAIVSRKTSAVKPAA